MIEIPTIKPDWNFKNIEVFTVLAKDADGGEFDFRYGSALFDVSMQKLLEELSVEKIYRPVLTHGSVVVEAPFLDVRSEADAVYTTTSCTVCAVTTADCLPVVIVDKQGLQVAVVHAGWRGLAESVIENTLEQFKVEKNDLQVWLGPAISQTHYEVGKEVYEQFEGGYKEKNAFTLKENGKYDMGLYKIARNILIQGGVSEAAVSGGEYCTYSDTQFHSVRRDGDESGRMLTLAYIKDT